MGSVKKRVSKESGKGKVFKKRNTAANIGIAAVSAIISAMLLLLIFAALTSAGVIPENMMPVITVICCFISAITGARTGLKGASEKRFLTGLGGGALMFLLLFAFGRAASPEAALGTVTLALLIASLAGGALGGYIGTKRKKAKRIR